MAPECTEKEKQTERTTGYGHGFGGADGSCTPRVHYEGGEECADTSEGPCEPVRWIVHWGMVNYHGVLGVGLTLVLCHDYGSW